MTREEAKDCIRERCPYEWQEEIIKALDKKGVTNQEYIATLTPEEFWNTIRWLQKEYGKRYADSYQAIIEWLSTERGVE